MSTLFRRVFVGLLLLGALAVPVATSDAAPQSTGSSRGSLSLKISDIVPLTGANSSFGPSFHKAAELAVAQARAAAKRAHLSLQIQLNEGDEGNTPQSAVTAARQETAGGASCILGGTGYSVPIATAVAIPGSIAQFSPADTTAAYSALHARGGLTFRTITPDATESRILAAYIAQKAGGAKGKLVSIAARNDSYGGPAADAFAAAWKKLGGKAQGPLLYDPNAASFDSEASKIVAHHPKFFVIFDYPDTYAKLAAALLRTGAFSARKLYTTAGFPSTIPSGMSTAMLNGAIIVGAGQPLGGRLTSAYNALYRKSSFAPKAQQPYNADNFDGAMLCILGAIAANSAHGMDIAKKVSFVTHAGAPKFSYLQLTQAIKRLMQHKPINYIGVSGTLQINAHGDPTGALSDVSQYKGRHLKLLKQVYYRGGRIVPATH